ncbi:cytochrome c [Desertibaculum subflavum]|uniref:cytochrome c n=1 Tax=Desertibaculum subflavum TaxID=2268458 RepID=UPI0034D2C2C0
MNLPKTFVLIFFLGGAGVLAWKLLDPGGGAAGNIKVPPLAASAAAGKAVFDANCAACHGRNGGGTTQGPPLIHDIYNPGHHSNDAFLRAVRMGSRQHHWKFGDMPAQPQVTDKQLAEIVSYVRALQEANGIVYRPHRM